MRTVKVAIVVSIAVAALASMAYFSGSMTGMYSKAFTKTVSSGDDIEQNITIRKYYNLTVRFRTTPTGSDINFDDEDAVVVLKNAAGNEIVRARGVTNGKIYLKMDKLNLDATTNIDSYNVSSYEDITGQTVNITYYGTKAYLTVIVEKKQGAAQLSGYIIDDLTDEPVSGITIAAFEKDADPLTQPYTAINTSNAIGIYSLVLSTDTSGKSYDIYVTDYTTV